MRKIFFIVFLLYLINANAQENVYPAKPNTGIIYIKNATIHTGNGKVIENGIIKINGSKIEQIGTDISIAAL